MLKEVRVLNFRNLSVPKIKLAAGCTVIVGENGQGKTNFLEAIYLLAYGKPLRGTRDEAINWQEDEATVSGEAESSKIQVILRRGKETQVLLNNKPKALAAILGKFLAVTFYPQEIELVTGPPALRRSFLDRLIATSDRDYLFNLVRYQQALGHKNRLLKEQAAPDDLEAWDKQLATFGSKVWLTREQATSALNQVLKLEAKRLIGKTLFLKYKSPVTSLDGKQAEKVFLRGLVAQRDLERRYLATVFGPHRDDWLIITEETRGKNILEKDLGTFASRGEQRQGVILLKLACGKFLKATFHKEATLLLDDVASELDTNNRELLLSNLPATQVIITTTNLEVLPGETRKKAAVLTVKEGKVFES